MKEVSEQDHIPQATTLLYQTTCTYKWIRWQCICYINTANKNFHTLWQGTVEKITDFENYFQSALNLEQNQRTLTNLDIVFTFLCKHC